MPKKQNTIAGEFLDFLFQAAEMTLPLYSSYPSMKLLRKALTKKSYYDSAYHLQKRGCVEFITKDGEKFLRLTQKGEIELLMAKAKVPIKGSWDGKWRLVIFDIPEDAKHKRNQLRSLLQANEFKKLQASVFISPHPLNREAITYLEQSGLQAYIRMLRVDEMDSDRKIKKQFGLLA